jgi:hypothetical protein
MTQQVGLTGPTSRSYTAITMHSSGRQVSALAIVLVLWMVGTGCGSKTMQYPEDHERYLRIDKAVESLRVAYVKKDSAGIAALLVPTESTERLQQEAEADFQLFHDMAMDFHVERIMIDNDDIDVYVHWQGLWRKDPEDPGIRHRGHSRLQWVGTKSVLLSGIQGDIPFGVNRRQALTGQPPGGGRK